MSYSVLYSAALSTLISLKHCSIVHQGPIRKKDGTPGNPETADIVGFRITTEGVPGKVVLVSDLKKDNNQLAVKETSLYAKITSLDRKVDPDNCCFVLGLAASTSTSTLILFLIAEKHQWGIPIINDLLPWNKILLATLAVAIERLSIKAMPYRAVKTPVPFKNKNVVPLKKNAYCRTFSDEDNTQVFKLLRQNDMIFKCNVELMKKVGILVTTKNFCLKYPFFAGDHCPKNLKQFHGIISMLDKVHRAGYVHCDIRIPNLIFGPNETDGSYLIDYDLARLNDVDCYPAGYYFNESIRHSDARECEIVQQRQDRYSLKLILLHIFGTEAEEIANRLETDEKLSEIAKTLV